MQDNIESPNKPSSNTQTRIQEPVFGVEKLTEISKEDFYKKKRQVFVITDTGKPVYSRYGEEADIAPIIATFNVILIKMANLRGSDT